MPTNDPLTWTFVVVVVLTTALVLIAVKGTLSGVYRASALGLAAALMFSGYIGFAELMSRPKPVSLEWARSNTGPVKVAASHLREKEAIYLWLVFDGET